jgi:tetratricopeptide (TPR) repeat protein
MKQETETIIEEGRRLSESTLWALQQSFYDQMGVTAWSSGTIPSYVTNNPFIADAYAELLLGFMRDYWTTRLSGAASPDRLIESSEPIYILELGAGSGRLGYLLVKRLLAVTRAAPWHHLKFCYVMSDMAESNLRFWNQHPALQPFLDEGVLDFSLYDPERQQAFTLFRSGRRISSQTVKHPLLIIANYLFDALTQDSFRVENGVLFEARYTLVSGQEEPDLTDPEILRDLRIRSEYRSIELDYYDDPFLNQLLADYRDRLGDHSFLLPVGAIRSIRNLFTLSSGSCLLLAADKGYVNVAQMLARDVDSDIEGMLSMTGMAVNCHALRHYFNQLGGEALHSSTWDSRLVISAFFAGDESSEFLETRAAFSTAIEQFSPYHFYALVERSREGKVKPHIEFILALLRLSRWDPQIVLWFAQPLREQLTRASASMKQELSHALGLVWENQFAIGEKEDLPFEIGTIYQKMGQPAEALTFYERSRQLSGAHHATEFNSGICFYQMEEVEKAVRHIERALALEPDYQPAKDWLGYFKRQQESGSG